MVEQGGGGNPSNPLPKFSGPWTIQEPGQAPESILWSRTDSRLYVVRLGGQQNKNLMLLQVGSTHTIAAARYTSNHRQGTPVCLVCNAYSGKITEAADAVFRALSEYIATRKLIWPLWQGLATADGRERPRGIAASLRILASGLYESTTLYVPILFGKEGPPPPS